MKQFGRSLNSEGISGSNTSRPATAGWPERRACASAPWSTTAPLAVFTRIDRVHVGPHRKRRPGLMKQRFPTAWPVRTRTREIAQLFRHQNESIQGIGHRATHPVIADRRRSS